MYRFFIWIWEKISKETKERYIRAERVIWWCDLEVLCWVFSGLDLMNVYLLLKDSYFFFQPLILKCKKNAGALEMF